MSEQAKPIDFVRLVLGTLLLSEDEVECLAHLGRAIFMAKQTPTDWKPLASIGVHAMGECLLGQYGARPSNWPGNELFGQALEPLEAMLASFTSRSDKDRLTVEDQRNRFYLKFAMGYVLTARGDMDEGRTLLRDLVETPLSTRGGIIRSGTEILDYSHDLAQAKFWIALLISNTYRDEQDYYRGLYLVTEAAASASWVAAGLSQIAVDLLDLLVTRCEQEDSSGEYDFPSFQWLDLFAESYELLSIYQEIDADAVMPNECEPGSPQFMAWHFGQLVGKFAVSDERWAGNTLDKTKDFRSPRFPT